MPTHTRQLAAIMFTDIVGYTAMMGKDSNKALELVRINKEIQKPLVEKYNGKWLKEMGDGAMAQFGSALDSVNCAVEIQELARAKFDGKIRIGIHSGDITFENNDVYGDGVNVAARLESIADPGGIYISESIEKAIRGQSDIQAKYLGEVNLKNVDYGVRTYALQGVGLPVPEIKEKKELSGRLIAEIKRRGVIRAGLMYVLIALLLVLIKPLASTWITFPDSFSTIFLVILGIGFPIATLLAWRYERSPDGFVRSTSDKSWQNPLKPSQRKPLTGNIIISGLALAILILFIYPGNKSDTKKAGVPTNISVIDKSIAILPFTNMSNDPDQEYFSDGMSEEIINKLAQINDLRVIARTSAFAFKGKGEDMREIGRKLNVAYLLEGSVRRAGNRLRITAQLISVADGSHLWSESFDREMDEAAVIFDIQDEISLAIVDNLKVNMLGSEKEAVTKRYTDNLDAYDLLIKGWYYLFTFTPSGLNNAIESFDQALQIDPNIAEAYASKGSTYISMPFWGNLAPNEVFPKARENALKALELDSANGQAYGVLAFISMMYDWDYETADRHFKTALKINPKEAIVHLNYSVYMGATQQFNISINEATLAVELDPLERYYNTRLGSAYLAAGQIDKAIEIQLKTISMNPNYFLAYQHLGDAYMAKSMTIEAIAAYEEAIELSDGLPSAQSGLAGAYYINGDIEKAIYILDGLEDRSKKEYVSPLFIFVKYLALDDTDKAFLWLERAIDERDPGILYLKFYSNDKFKIPDEPRFTDLLHSVGFENL
jgi:adenylate cyclase